MQRLKTERALALALTLALANEPTDSFEMVWKDNP